jgi:hypothetical protein
MKTFRLSILLLAVSVAVSLPAADTNTPNNATASTNSEIKSTSPAELDRKTDEKIIDAVMEKLERTYKAGDYTYAFEVMYSPIMDRIGGKAKGLELARAVAAQAKEEQIIIVSWTPRKPYKFVTGTSHTYAIIPYESLITIAGKKMKQTSFQFAIKVSDSKWEFVNGDNLNPEMLAELFPDFPKDIELPKLERAYEGKPSK